MQKKVMSKLAIFIIVIVLIATSGVIYSSCQKENIISDKVQETKKASRNGYEIFYYLDFVQIPEDSVNFEDTSKIQAIRCDVMDSGDTIIIYDFFSSTTNYLMYGRMHNFKVAELLLFEEKISAYIAKNNVIAIYERSGVFPSNYLEYEDSLYTAIFGRSRGSVVLRDNYYANGGGSGIVLTCPTQPTLGSWNNKARAYEHVTLSYGFVAFYKANFWGTKNRLATIHGFGFNKRDFSSTFGLAHLDKKVKSMIFN